MKNAATALALAAVALQGCAAGIPLLQGLAQTAPAAFAPSSSAPDGFSGPDRTATADARAPQSPARPTTAQPAARQSPEDAQAAAARNSVCQSLRSQRDRNLAQVSRMEWNPFAGNPIRLERQAASDAERQMRDLGCGG